MSPALKDSARARGNASLSLQGMLVLFVPAMLIVAAAFGFVFWQLRQDVQQSELSLIDKFGLTSPAPSRLDAKFIDADGDLLADAPQESAQQISPDTLVFSPIAGPSADAEREDWNEFEDYLASRIGKPVEVVAFETTDAQLNALRSGQVHLAGLNTGTVPVAVSRCGFIPFCAIGRDDGGFGTAMKLIVPTSSSIKNLDELCGQTITFTDRASNSGFRAPVYFLMNIGLLPERDYNWNFSLGHPESIEGIARGDYKAAPVDAGMLQRSIAAGSIEPGQYREIYVSDNFPPATFGYVYNLPPDLAEKIRTALLEFKWAGTGVEKRYSPSGDTRFVPITYKTDFELVRKINDSLRQPPSVAVGKEGSGESKHETAAGDPSS